MDDNYKGTGIKINWLPFPYTLGDLIAEFVRSFSVYNGKEALAVLARHNIEANSRFGRFPLLLRLPRHHEDFLREDPPTVSATSQARSSHHTWQQGPRPDLPEGDGDEEDAVVLSGSQLQAGRTIAKWWVTQWPLLQERRSFSKSDLGRATIDIGVLCQTIDIVDISNQYLGHTRTLSRFGPEPYSRLCSALKLGKRAVSAFQRVFAALPTGENELRADDLEKIDGWSEEVNKHIAQLERIKANIMDGIVVTKMGVVQLKVKLAEISGQAKVSEEKFVELTGNLDRVIAASRVKH